MFDGNVIKPNETNIKASSGSNGDPDHGFFHSMLVLLVLLKGKILRDFGESLLGTSRI